MSLYYLDTGVFVTPFLKNQPIEIIEICEGWLRRIDAGEIEGVTSCLTWDEFTHVRGLVPKPYDYARAQQAGEMFLALSNLRLVPADLAVVRLAQSLLDRLKPRDAIHAASALLHADGNLITLDGNFGTIATSKGTLKVVRIIPSVN